MNLFDPWENISIQKINHNEVIQYFDSQIQIAYVLMGEITIVEDKESTNLKGDDRGR